MGYKLAGYEVIGCNEIDPKMAEAYKKNHKPKYCYVEPIQEFKLRNDFPRELYELDVLDGSPPCSSFSTAGKRHKDWGKKKKFREGQAKQVLDTLFFDFIDLAGKLQPKIIVVENVKGLIQGKAKNYLYKIHNAFTKAGYKECLHLLDSSKMGVPQKRERVFFIAARNDLAGNLEFEDIFCDKPLINLNFNEKEILFREVQEPENFENKLSPLYKELWSKRIDSDLKFLHINARVRNKPNTGFGTTFAKPNKVCGTLTSKSDCYCDFETGRYLSSSEVVKIQTFPSDYNFLDNRPGYICGMSVPPVMMAQIAHQIYEQWITKISRIKIEMVEQIIDQRDWK